MRPYVVNRCGEHVLVRYDKITDRVEQLAGNDLNITPEEITFEAMSKIVPGMRTTEIDNFIADLCDQFASKHPDYRKLAARIANDNLVSDLPSSYLRCIAIAHFFDWRFANELTPLPAPGSRPAPKDSLISTDFYRFIWTHSEEIDQIYTPRVTRLDYVGFRMLERKYLMRIYYNTADEPAHQTVKPVAPLPRLTHHTESSVSMEHYTEAQGDKGSNKFTAVTSPTSTATPAAIRFLTAGKSASRVIETPAGLYLRVACDIARSTCPHIAQHPNTINKCSHGAECPAVRHIALLYQLMYEDKLLTFATPALLNAGHSRHGNFISCFVIPHIEDSIEGIYEVLKTCSVIAKASGGIGIPWSIIRAAGAYISGSNSTSGGVYPALRLFNASSQYVGQHGNNRPSSMANYFEPWHADLLDVIRKLDPHTTIDGDLGTIRKLFFGLWITDIFMRRVYNDEMWTFMSPDICPGLDDTYGEEHERLYMQYEAEGRGSLRMPARKVWEEIIKIKFLSGQPYFLSKDTSNALSNQQHLGTIRGSNLCTEIIEYHGWRVATELGETEPSLEIACCTLASISLNEMVKHVSADDAGDIARTTHGGTLAASTRIPGGSMYFDFGLLQSVARSTTRYLDMVIDVTNYPHDAAGASNKRHRPLGMGIRGLADVFLQLGYAFTSPEAQHLNKQIFETLYFAALTESTALAVERGTYPSYPGSPASRGLLHMDLWETRMADLGRQRAQLKRHPNDISLPEFPSHVIYDADLALRWKELRHTIKCQGLRNSLLIAPMPTESTSQIIGGSKSFEPYQYCMYRKETNSGGYKVINPYMAEWLSDHGLWSDEIISKIENSGGSMANIPEIPEKFRELFKTSVELPQRTITAMAAAVQPFIDQSMSLNHRMAAPTIKKFSTLMFDAWMSGLKTWSYYLSTEAATTASNITATAANGRRSLRWTSRHDVSSSTALTPTSLPPQSQQPTSQPLFCNRNDPTCEACSA